MRRAAAIAWFVIVGWCLSFGVNLSAATVPAGFTESVISGPWSDAVGTAFESNGRIYVWERTGKVWFKDTGDASFTLLLDISDEVGAYNDVGLLGFALDPNFRVNGYIYLLYVVDRHHLLNFGTSNYDPNANEYFAATIGRLTRYTCNSSNGFRSVDLASRMILLGETKQTGVPICTASHSVGSVVFGEDGTLLVSTGDGSTAYAVDVGGANGQFNFDSQALADGILRPKENVGAFRSQLVDCLNGKILRLDPATGNGLPSNPYYDATNPRSPRSRVWALGLRNPCRMELRPESGSHNPADGNPGVLYVGDVGWDNWECLKVVTGPRQNFGWPIYEGLDLTPTFAGETYQVDIANLDAPNPLYPGSGCSQYFSFRNLLKEDTVAANGQPPFANPCNSSQKIPSSIPQFLHARPVLDWNHDASTTRTPIYNGSGQAQTADVGPGGSPVSGPAFKGNCAIGGTWYTGTSFPAQYQNTYFFADWGQGVIKTLTVDQNDKPVALADFASNAGAIVSIVQHPVDGSLYYISYNYSGATVRQLAYTSNRRPVAVASSDQYYGPTPLAVQFSSSGSSDPDGQPITYSWNFGDGSPVSTLANPSHTFSAPAGVPTKFVVTLTVTDGGGLSAQATMIVGVNDTPPDVTITSPVDGALYSPSNAMPVNLTATVSDAESSDGQLDYQWQVLLHHNDHDHGSPADTNHVTTTVIEPTGCDGVNIYYYRFVLTVTDPTGLSTTREVRLYPNCGTPDTPPVISAIPNQSILQNGSTAPINFTVWDAETAAANLQLSAASSNPTLVPVSNIVFGGCGSDRTVTVTPAVGQAGSATITVTANDGSNNSSTNFLVTVIPSITVTMTNSFTNAAAIAIPDKGAGTPYPSTINVSGMGGTVKNVTLTLRNLSHTWTSDIDVLLVGPGGQKVIVMSDTGSGRVNNINLTFSDAAAGSLPSSGAIASGTYKPTNLSDNSLGGDNFPSPAPAAPYELSLSAFNGAGANGPWSLYVFDDGVGDVGSFAGGWSLTVSTVSASQPAPPTISDITNQVTRVNTPTLAIPFTVGDAETAAGSLNLSKNSSNLTLVPTSNIVFGGSGPNRTVTVTPAANQTGTATITVTVSDGTFSTYDTFVLTVKPANTAPTISDISDQFTTTNTPTAAIPFTVGDEETAAGNLTLNKGSSNPTLLPTNNIVFGGSGGNRTVTLTPAAGQTGTSTITVTVSDGTNSTSESFVLAVNKAQLTVTGITANNKVYDNTTNATLNTASATLVRVTPATRSGDIAFRFLSVTNDTTARSAYISSQTYQVGSNCLVLAAVLNSDVNMTPTNVSGNGLSWQWILTTNFNTLAAPASALTVYAAMSNNVSLSGRATVQFATNQTGCSIYICEFTNVWYAGGALGAIVQTNGRAADSSVNPSNVLSAALPSHAQDAVVAFFGGASNPFSATPEAGWTEDADSGYATPNTGLGVYHRLQTTDKDLVLTRTASAWASVMMELRSLNDTPPGPLGGDVVTLVTAGATGAFTNENVGNGKLVRIAGLTLSGADAGKYTLVQPTTNANITAKGLTVTGITANNKAYDNTTNTTLNAGSAALVGVVSPDVVTLSTAGGTGAFTDETAGNGKLVRIAGLTLSGADAGNYTLTQPTTTANITAKGLTVMGITAIAKVYDNTTTAALNTGRAVLVGVVCGDVVTLGTGSATGTFANETVGLGKPVAVSGLTISGTDSGNYQVTQPTTTGNITAKPVTPVIVASDKTYDGSTTTTLSSQTVSGTIGADVVTLGVGAANFDTRNAGMGKTVTATTLTLGGAGAGNYVLGAASAAAVANITAKTVIPVIVANDKPYDGSTTATLSGQSVTGTIGADAVTLSVGAANFDTKNVGLNKTVTGTALSLGGTDASNYVLGAPTATDLANITAKTVTPVIVANDKTYDGTTAATLSGQSVTGTIGAEVVTLGVGAANFDTKNAGTGKTVTATTLTLGGADAGNYVLNAVSVAGLANMAAKAVTPVIVANNKTYDGSTTATLSSHVVTGTIGADVVTLGVGAANFDTKNAGTGKAVTAATLSLGGADAGNYVLSAVSATALADITAKTVTPVIVSVNKTYDGNTTATLSSQSVTGAIGAEVVTLGVGDASFDSKNVGAGKAVTATTLSLGGADAGNYVLGAASAMALANITAKTVTPVILANSKVYDGSTTATLSSQGVTGAIGVEVVTLGVGAANFDTKNVGVGKTVTGTALSLGGADAGNYVLDSATATHLANITAKTVTPVIVANNKLYDGHTLATLISRSVMGTIGADVVLLGLGEANFDTKNVGTGKSVTGTDLSLGGADAGNYTLSAASATDLADITAKSVTPVIVANNKAYDGTTTATLSSQSVTGTIGLDEVTLGVGEANFDTKNVGTGKSVTATTLTLGGVSAGNYVLGAAGAMGLADITKAQLTVTADDKSRAYGADNPTLTATITGFVSREMLATSGVTGSPDLSTVATDVSPAGSYPITVAIGSLSAVNYSFNFVDGMLGVTNAMPVILSFTGAGTTNVVLTWSATSNITYRVQYRPDLNSGNWLDLLPDVTATSDTASAVDNLGNANQRFYRILIAP